MKERCRIFIVMGKTDPEGPPYKQQSMILVPRHTPGSGKSTTASVIVTLAAPSSGTVTVLGHDAVREPTAVRRLLGVALQETGVDPLQTARELLTLHARLLGAPRQRVAELLVAEVYDVLTAPDSYRLSISPAEAEAELRLVAGTP